MENRREAYCGTETDIKCVFGIGHSVGCAAGSPPKNKEGLVTHVSLCRADFEMMILDQHRDLSNPYPVKASIFANEQRRSGFWRLSGFLPTPTISTRRLVVVPFL